MTTRINAMITIPNFTNNWKYTEEQKKNPLYSNLLVTLNFSISEKNSVKTEGWETEEGFIL